MQSRKRLNSRRPDRGVGAPARWRRWVAVCGLGGSLVCGIPGVGHAEDTALTRSAEPGGHAAEARLRVDRSGEARLEADPPGEARLSLGRFVDLVRSSDAARQPAEPEPPLGASLQQIAIEGSVLQDGLDLEVRMRVVVLAENTWTRVELLQLSEHSHLAALPAIPGGMLAIEEGALVLVTRTPRTYDLELHLMQRATREDRLRRAELRIPSSAPAELRLRFPPGLFRLTESPVRQDAGGSLFLPENGLFRVAWEPSPEVAAPALSSEPPAAAEPMIPFAQASCVETLEGTRITRIGYALRFAGAREIRFELPAGEHVQQVYLNGRSVPFEVVRSELSVRVTPARSGGESADLELVLTREVPHLLLSGRLRVALPTAGWPVSELVLDLHLPEVFEYAWEGGSLSPVDAGPLRDFVYDIPRPGKRLSFHQYLVRRATPDVTLAYTVDLAGRYFQ